MQKLGFPSMRRLDQFKSLSKSVAGSAKTFSSSPRPPETTASSGSFANLKLTAEKLMKEQASVKNDLEMANTKLKKSVEHIHALEGKLQNAFNENAKFKVKQKEDEKLWKALESKFSSTKTLCDQLTETLQLLAGQVQDAEKDKEAFEGKLSASAVALDGLNQQMNDLSIKLESAEKTSRNREKELEKRKLDKEKSDNFYRNEQCRTTNLIGEKDAMIKKFEETLATNRLSTESLNTKLAELHLELNSKEDEIRCLITSQESLETEKHDVQLKNDDLVKRLETSVLELKNLEGFVHVLASHLVELDRQSLNFLEKFDKLNSLYEGCFQLANQEKDLSTKLAQRKYDQLHDRFLNLTSERDAIQVVNMELNNKIVELQKVQESVMAQLSEECLIARERIQKLEYEAEALVSKKIETEKFVSELELQIDSLSENSRSSENKMQDLLLKMSALEAENKDNTEKLLAEIQQKVEQIDGLLKEGEKHEHHVDLMDKQVSQLQNTVEEKEQLILHYKELEKNLGERITENQASLTAAETKLAEDKKQYDLMLESKQLELSRHLKDISHRNDQAIDDIRKKYEVEKQEIVNMEKEKAEKLVGERERECEKKLEECKEESRQNLMHVQEEHAALVITLQQEHDKKELSLKAKHSEVLKKERAVVVSRTCDIALIRNGLVFMAAEGRVLSWDEQTYARGRTKKWPIFDTANYKKIQHIGKNIMIAIAGDLDLCDAGVNYIRDRVENEVNSDLNLAVAATEEYLGNIDWSEYTRDNKDMSGIEFLLCGYLEGMPRVFKRGYAEENFINDEIREDQEFLTIGSGAQYADDFVDKHDLESINTPKDCLKLVMLSVVAASTSDCACGGIVRTCALFPNPEDTSMANCGHVISLVRKHKHDLEDELKYGLFIDQEISGVYSGIMEKRMMNMMRKIQNKDESTVSMAVRKQLHQRSYRTIHFVKCHSEKEKNRVMRGIKSATTEKKRKAVGAHYVRVGSEVPDFGKVYIQDCQGKIIY